LYVREGKEVGFGVFDMRFLGNRSCMGGKGVEVLRCAVGG
jgi:hypothetical protein